MSLLFPLRSRLDALRRRLWLVRVGTLYSRLGLAYLAVLGIGFLLDYALEPPPAARAPVAIGIGVLTIWLLGRVLREAFRRQPTYEELAIQVQRQLQIDSDLVAALQFEQPQAQTWGSRQLQAAVIQRVAERSAQLDPARDVSRRPLAVSAGLLLLALAVTLLLCARFPEHARVFAHRLLLGREHYPTATRIEFVYVNGTAALAGGRTQATQCAYGNPVEFRVEASGELPAEGFVSIRRPGGKPEHLALKPTVDRARQVRLETALAAIRELQTQAVYGGDVAPGDDFAKARLAIIEAAAGDAEIVLNSTPREAELHQWERRIVQALARRSFFAQLRQLGESLQFQVYLGDAWTDPLALNALPLPVVEVALHVTPPEYTRQAEASGEIANHQATVIEGSRVELRLQSTKPLREATLAIHQQTFALRSVSADGLRWRTPNGTLLDAVTENVSYSVQVRDRDGMQLPEPIKGFIRLKADRPPKVFAAVATRHVLPTAKPNIWFGAVDDYGLAAIKVHLRRVRAGEEGPPKSLEVPLQGHPRRLAPLLGSLPAELRTALDRQTLSTELRNELAQIGIQVSPEAQLAAQQPGARWLLTDTQGGQTLLLRLERDAVRVYRQFLINLSALDLHVDDELKLELEAVDFRGNQIGKSGKSEVVVLHVTDERGVYAAMQESDQRTAHQLNDIIQHHLGIGGSP